MKKRFKRLLCVLLLMCLCFSEVVISPNVNTTISEAKKKKKYPYIKDIEVKFGDEYCLVNKYSKPFLKYVSWNKEAKRVDFDYTGSDRVIHLPNGPICINSFAPGWSFNETVEEIYIYNSLNSWAEGDYFSEEGDDQWYSCFYQCKNLKKVHVIYTNSYFEKWGPQVNKKGTWLYRNWRSYPRTTFWKKDERIPINY